MMSDYKVEATAPTRVGRMLFEAESPGYPIMSSLSKVDTLGCRLGLRCVCTEAFLFSSRRRRALTQPLRAIKEKNISEPRINERIRVPEVRLVGPQGEQVGIVRIEDALRLAVEADLDLVEVAPTAKPPVCKLMDFGKWKYEAAVKARDARKKQTNTVLKEVRFRLKIDTHDYETKTARAQKFLEAGDKVKAMIQFRGREQQRPQLGIQLLEQFADDVADYGAVESAPRQDGRNMVMVVGPLKTKSEARADARREGKGPQGKQERSGGGSRRDQAAREAKANRSEEASTKPTPVKNSISDSMPEELKNMSSDSNPEAPNN